MSDQTLKRDRVEIEGAVVDAYTFWMRSGMPFINHSFERDGVHYEWATNVFGKDGEAAWSIDQPPNIEGVTETVAIFEHCPECGEVYVAEPEEVEALLFEAVSRGDFGELLQ